MNFFPKGSVNDPIASGCSRSARTEVFPVVVERLCCWSSRHVATNQDIMTLAQITTQKIMHYIINYIMHYMILHHHVLIMYSFVLGELYAQLLGVVAGNLDAGLTPSPWQERLVEAEQVADSGGKSVCSEATKVTVEMTSEFLKLLKVLVFVSCAQNHPGWSVVIFV